ncbi:hypothetical protein C9I98_00365 [Photobacterium sanctipauli]|uniref:Thioredoxin domain-containing protein n=1 Tax=Photobacterium sanctipauli TaxID=1342794 RepID=A0A2T3NZQ2_9GAMM|nr:hypothetical protein [Photobacterium sanctipauli]PSW21756.1 hypothetical protein C9I98_00365 [Photobacterium sanctipauli]
MSNLQPQYSAYDGERQKENVGRVTIVCSEHQLVWLQDTELSELEIVLTTAAECGKYNLKRIPSILFHEHGLIASGIKLSTAVQELKKTLRRKARHQMNK